MDGAVDEAEQSKAKEKKCVRIVDAKVMEKSSSDDDGEDDHRLRLIRALKRRLSLPVQKGLFGHSFQTPRSNSIVGHSRWDQPKNFIFIAKYFHQFYIANETWGHAKMKIFQIKFTSKSSMPFTNL